MHVCSCKAFHLSISTNSQVQRSSSGIFAGKYGLITLRDLFRWGERYKRSGSGEKFHDWDQQLAEDGESCVGCVCSFSAALDNSDQYSLSYCGQDYVSV